MRKKKVLRGNKAKEEGRDKKIEDEMIKRGRRGKGKEGE